MKERVDNTTNSTFFQETEDVCYEFTSTTFKKTSRLPHLFTANDGTSCMWFRPWNHERIANEARALKLVSRNTTIPVPKLLDHGVLPDGRQYLITEYIHGVLLSQLSDQGCLSPEGNNHTESTDSTPCGICRTQAYGNALKFINGVVSPQLAELKSNERGIEGFVMPPSWLSLVQPPWKGKEQWETLPLDKTNYVFQHGDIAAHNIIMDRQTLQVRAVIDWEFAGHFLEGTERWPGTLDASAYNRRGHQLAGPIAKYLPIDYLACYDQWEDKAELAELIQNEELPAPDPLRKAYKEDWPKTGK